MEDEPAVTADLVKRLRRRAERVDGGGGKPLRLSLSIGAIDWESGDHGTLQELIERAAQCMYDDKRARRP